jgi:Fe-S cluster biogenesis protein NfuA
MDTSNIRERVEMVLVQVRPYLEIDKGGVEYVLFEEETGVLELRLTGNCRDCPMSLMTLRAGIERYIIKNIPEVRRVENVSLKNN